MQAFLSPNLGALSAGLITFLVIYVLGTLLLVFGLSLWSEVIGAELLSRSFRYAGYAALCVPGYVAARIAGRQGLFHGLLVGAAVGLMIILFMTFTFSWEGTVKVYVLSSMGRNFIGALILCGAGGLAGDWMNRRGS